MDGLSQQARFLADYTQASYSFDHIPYKMIRDAISPHQSLSKLWMAIEFYSLKMRQGKLDKFGLGNPTSLSYFGSWLGVGPRFLASAMNLAAVFLVDKDPDVKGFAEYLCMTGGIDITVSICEDMTKMDPASQAFQSEVLVNTSIEHLSRAEYAAWWETLLWHGNQTGGKGKARCVILQGTDMSAADHRNFKDAGSFVYGGLEPLYKGALKFDDGSTRYMLIGVV
jgi:hypothetical protein